MRYFAFLFLMLSTPVFADVFIREDINTEPAPDNFTVCHGNGCVRLDFMRLMPEQWLQVRRQFEPPPPDAAQERERIRRAIALMEKFVGEKTGTWRDKGGTFNYGEGQMDCMDESTNTSLYLKMFEKSGLMRFHQVVDRETRGWFFSGWPHTSAVIRERSADPDKDKSGRWAVDSWFLDNGEPPYVLPLEIWKSGWEPIR